MVKGSNSHHVVWHAQRLWEVRGLRAIATPFDDSGTCHTDDSGTTFITPVLGASEGARPQPLRRATRDDERRRQTGNVIIHISRTGP